eukprot:TRINITY_DN23002_c0_g1_i1.p1 TRINITY_DN23002_c0_g1~~TRINITY_DN23002_c0_g1_i1.p1  ORF type:complete len:1015 (+),score=180.94 TRINITY_DN23002_c0_g1_i1:108-3152(+)
MPVPSMSPGGRATSPWRQRRVMDDLLPSRSPTLAVARNAGDELRALTRQERIRRIDDVLASYGMAQLVAPRGGHGGVQSPRRPVQTSPQTSPVRRPPPVSPGRGRSISPSPRRDVAATAQSDASPTSPVSAPREELRRTSIPATHPTPAPASDASLRSGAAAPQEREAPSAAVYVSHLSRPSLEALMAEQPSPVVWEGTAGSTTPQRIVRTPSRPPTDAGPSSVEERLAWLQALEVKHKGAGRPYEGAPSAPSPAEPPPFSASVRSLAAGQEANKARYHCSHAAALAAAPISSVEPELPRPPLRVLHPTLEAARLTPGAPAAHPTVEAARQAVAVRMGLPPPPLPEARAASPTLVSPARPCGAEEMRSVRSLADTSRLETEKLLQNTKDLMTRLAAPMPQTAGPTPLPTTQLKAVKKKIDERRAPSVSLSSEREASASCVTDGDETEEESSTADGVSTSLEPSLSPSPQRAPPGPQGTLAVGEEDGEALLPTVFGEVPEGAFAEVETTQPLQAEDQARKQPNPTTRRFLARLRKPRKLSCGGTASEGSPASASTAGKASPTASAGSGYQTTQNACTPQSQPRSPGFTRTAPQEALRSEAEPEAPFEHSAKHQQQCQLLNQLERTIKGSRRAQRKHRASTSPNAGGISREFAAGRHAVQKMIEEGDVTVVTAMPVGEIAEKAQARDDTKVDGRSGTPRLNPLSLHPGADGEAEDGSAPAQDKAAVSEEESWEAQVREALDRVESIGDVNSAFWRRSAGEAPDAGAAAGRWASSRIITPCQSIAPGTSAASLRTPPPTRSLQELRERTRSVGTLSQGFASHLRAPGVAPASASHTKSLEVMAQTHEWLGRAQDLYAGPPDPPSQLPSTASAGGTDAEAFVSEAQASSSKQLGSAAQSGRSQCATEALSASKAAAAPLQNVDPKGFVTSLAKIELLAKCDFDTISSKLESLKGKMEAARQAWSTGPALPHNPDAWVGVDLPGGLWGPHYTQISRKLHDATRPDVLDSPHCRNAWLSP